MAGLSKVRGGELGWLIAGVGGAVLAIVNRVRGIVGTWIVWWIGLAIFDASLVGALGTVN